MNEYTCKFPKRMEDNAYYKKIMDEMQASDQYNDLLRDEMKWLLWNVIINIKIIIQKAKDEREKILDFIASLDTIPTKEDYFELVKAKRPHKKCNSLFTAVHGCGGILEDSVENPRPGMSPRYRAYLKEVTTRCIKDIVAANRPSMKKVGFKENIAEEFIIDNVCTVDISSKIDGIEEEPQESAKQLTMLFDSRKKISFIENMPLASNTTSSPQGKKRNIAEMISENENIPTQSSGKKLKKAEFES